MKIQVSAPGKLILFGEHAVVYGKKAIATSLDDLRSTIVLKREDGELLNPVLSFHAPKIGFSNFSIPIHKFIHLRREIVADGTTTTTTNTTNTITTNSTNSYYNGVSAHNATPKVNEKIVSELRKLIELELGNTTCTTRGISLLGAMYLYLYLTDLKSRNIYIEAMDTSLPIGAGLGSSASFSVCLASSMLAAFQLIHPTRDKIGENDLFTINKWAYFIEELIHGTPSGIDNTVATFGGVVSFTKGHTPEKLDTIPGNLKILIVDTTVPRDTKALVAGVRSRYEKDESYKGYMNEIESCSNDCLSLFVQMQKNELDREEYISRLQQLINKNQKYLRLIGVSHPSLERVIQLASEHNLFAKLTGAGGGGCAFVLLDEDENKTVQFRNMLSNEGFKCYMSNVGHEGVLINLIP